MSEKIFAPKGSVGDPYPLLPRNRHGVEMLIFGCTCSGPCDHPPKAADSKIVQLREWFINSNRLFAFVAWLWFDVLKLTEKFEG